MAVGGKGHSGPVRSGGRFLLLGALLLTVRSDIGPVLPGAAHAYTADVSARYPATVEEYWSGRANCLAAADGIDERARRTLHVLARYSEPVTRDVKGVKLVDQPLVLVEALKALTTEMPANSFARLAAGCSTALCAAERIFGQVEGLRMLHLFVRYRYNASHWADRNAVPWTVVELGDLLLALGDLPPAVVPFRDQDMRPLVHEARHGRLAELVPHAEQGVVTIVAISGPSNKVGIRTSYAWHLMPQPTRRASVFHELAHDFFWHQREHMDAEALWRQAIVTDSRFGVRNGRAFLAVSKYASSSIYEDFAESAVAYRYAPEFMRDRAPNRARLLKAWLFDGLAYDTPAKCNSSQAYSHIAAARAIEGLPTHQLSPGGMMQIVRECRQLLKAAESRRQVTRGRLCMGRALYGATFGDAVREALDPGDPISPALANERVGNQAFIEEQFGQLSDERIVALTTPQVLASCEGSCHGADRP